LPASLQKDEFLSKFTAGWTDLRGRAYQTFDRLRSREMTKTRRKIDGVLKAKIALEALREQAAVTDLAQRHRVLSWRLSNTMDASFCVAALEEATARYGKPDIFTPTKRDKDTFVLF
jgi:hypothetical protein